MKIKRKTSLPVISRMVTSNYGGDTSILIEHDDDEDNVLFYFETEESEACCGVISLCNYSTSDPIPRGRSKEFADKFVDSISNEHGFVTMEFVVNSAWKDNHFDNCLAVMKALLKHGGFKKGPRFVNPKTKNTIQQIYAVINQP